MKSIIQIGYRSPDVFVLKDIDKPLVKDNDALVQVHAACLHAGDYFAMRGKPYGVRLAVGLFKPRRNYIPGFDFAGVIEAVGKNVMLYKPGDEVFGACNGTCAEYVCAQEKQFLPKPVNLTFEEAAAVPTSAVTALLGLRNVGKIQSGQNVLINGASGGVGTFAVQIAKAYGAEVTGVCSTRKMDLVRSLGADHVIDYTREDYTKSDKQYDIILDNVANHSLTDSRRVLTSQGILIPNSGHSGMGYIIKAFFSSLFIRQQSRPYLAVPKDEDLLVLKELIESGKVTPVIDRSFPLDETPEAFRYLNEGHAQGKVVIRVEHNKRSNKHRGEKND